jgi:hypothetical protein
MIWKICKKGNLNSEKIGKIWKKGKLNSEKICKIWKKPKCWWWWWQGCLRPISFYELAFSLDICHFPAIVFSG